MTLRTFVYSVVAIAWFGLPALASGDDAHRAVEVVLTSPAAAVVGTPVAVSCAATDADGIAKMSLRVTAPNGTGTTLGATFGAAELAVKWAPVVPGTHVLRCRAKGMSSDDADDAASRAIEVTGAPVAETPVAVPAAVSVAATAAFPAAPPTIGSVVHEGRLGVAMNGPRRVAATPAGDLYVVDSEGVLFRLTKRGDVVGALLGGAVSVAAGSDLVFVGLKGGVVVGVHPATGRVVTRFDMGTSEAPAGLVYDEARGRLWLAFGSGVVQVRGLDGTIVTQIAGTPAGPLSQIVDAALSPSGLVWLSQDRGEGAYLHGFDAETGNFVRSIAGATASEARIIGGIAAAWGRLYVADLFSGNVRVLNENGATLELLGKPGTGPGELSLPAGVAFMVNGDVVVANRDANRVERFGAGADLPVCPGDRDCDGLPDAWEIANHLDPDSASNVLADADRDGLNAAEEYAYGTNPNKADSDGDGYADGAEIASGFNPNDATDHDPVMVVDVPSVVDPGVVQLAASINDRGHLGGCSAAWRQVSGPVASIDRDAVSPSFIARRGVYRFKAVATCGGRASQPADLTVAIRNLPARVDLPRVVATGGKDEHVNVSARFSSDANGDELRFEWTQSLGRAVMESKEGPTLSTELEDPGLYGFQVTVDDRWGHPASGEVAVVYVGAGGAPTAVIPAQLTARAGEEVFLDASASFRGSGAQFVWEQVSGTPVVLAGSGAAVSFLPEGGGTYGFRVSVVDGRLRSPPAEVAVFVAPRGGELPVASAYVPSVVAVNRGVTLSGAGSRGAGPLKYAWKQVRGPAAGLTRADQESATVVAFAPGAYEFELAVDDGFAASVPVRVAFEARAGGSPIPVAVASGPASAKVGERVTLSGAASVGASDWRWTQVEGPWVELKSGSSASFRPYAPGVYGFELVVDDGKVRSAPARLNVVVGN